MKILRRHSGFSLIEVVISLGLGAFVMSGLAVAFKVSEQNWRSNNNHAELIQHARVSMYRITNDLRYATALNDTRAVPGALEFDTTVLEDSNEMTIETIRYEQSATALNRSANGGATYQLIAGSTLALNDSEPVGVSYFIVRPLKLNGVNLVDLLAGDSIDEAVAVELDLTFRDMDSNIFRLTTLVNLRNKI